MKNSRKRRKTEPVSGFHGNWSGLVLFFFSISGWGIPPILDLLRESFENNKSGALLNGDTEQRLTIIIERARRETSGGGEYKGRDPCFKGISRIQFPILRDDTERQ